MEKKKLLELIGAIAIAVLFITSYAAFGNSSPSSTTTVSGGGVPQTFYATATSNAVISGYGPVMAVGIGCANANNESEMISNTLAALEANNSVSNYFAPSSKDIEIYTGNTNASSLYGILYGSLGPSYANCTYYNGTADIKLPVVVDFTVQTQTVPVVLDNSTRQGSLPITFMQNMDKNVTVKVAALLTVNGTVYGAISVTKA